MSCKTDAEMLAKHLPVMLMIRVLLVRSERWGGVFMEGMAMVVKVWP